MTLLFSVVTTIQEPTAAMRTLSRALRAHDAPLIAIGDRKGPRSFELERARFVPIDEQRALGFSLAEELPERHYARKNLGYLLAIRDGAGCIYETDDDNAPLPSWTPRTVTTNAVAWNGPSGWANVYRAFSSANIWPRGLPLDAIPESGAYVAADAEPASVVAPIQQGLANGSPDVDAVWRLVLDRDFSFDDGPSVLLRAGQWCPFNSQSTWWWPEAYPLLYLPSYCTFRMTDIWRSFVAQRCLWAMGRGLVFHAPEVVQDRNEHDLMRDFEHEVPGYLRNRELASCLDALELDEGAGAVGSNLLRCYEALAARDFFAGAELDLVRAWLADLRSIGR